MIARIDLETRCCGDALEISTLHRPGDSLLLSRPKQSSVSWPTSACKAFLLEIGSVLNAANEAGFRQPVVAAIAT